MKKSEQTAINAEVIATVERFNSVHFAPTNWKKLRSCSAEVAPCVDPETGEILFYALRSYRTIVAIIDCRTDTLYDFLRYVYGYTSTSAQHITKFSKDYGLGKWGCANVLRYYPV